MPIVHRGKNKHTSLKWTPERIEVLRRRTAEGATAAQIAEAFQTTRWAIDAARVIFGVRVNRRPRRTAWTAADDAALRKGLAAKLGNRALAEQLNRTVYAVQARLRMLGIVSGRKPGPRNVSPARRQRIARTNQQLAEDRRARAAELERREYERVEKMLACMERIAHLRKWEARVA